MSREYSSAIRPLRASKAVAGAWLAILFLATLTALSGLPPGWTRVLAVSAAGILACASAGRIAAFEPPCRRVRLSAGGRAELIADETLPVSLLAPSLLSPRFGWLLARDARGRTWALAVSPAGQEDAYRRFYVAWRWGRASGRV